MSVSDIVGVIAGGLSLTQLLTLAASVKVTHAKLSVAEARAKALIAAKLGKDADLTFPFNPSTLRLSHGPEWSDGLTQSVGPRPIRYGGQPTDRLTFTVLFDESEYNGGTAASILTALMPFHGVSDLLGFVVKNETNVLRWIKQLYLYTEPRVWAEAGESVYAKRPPIMKLEWGPIVFNGVIDDLQTEFLLFDQDGGPRRATVDITMRGLLEDDIKGLVEVMPLDELKKKQDANLSDVKSSNTQALLTGGNTSTSV